MYYHIGGAIIPEIFIKCIVWYFQQWESSFLMHGMVKWSIVLYNTLCRGTSYYMLQLWWSGPKSCGVREVLTEKLHVTPLAGQISVWKLARALFQRVCWPKLHETVTSFIHSSMAFAHTKDSTAVPSGLLQPLPVLESRLSSYSIGFTTDLPLAHGYNTIFTYVNHLKKYTSYKFPHKSKSIL